MAKLKSLPEEITRPRPDVSLGGLEYPDGTYVCMRCFREPGFHVKVTSTPLFRIELTGKEKCSLCSKTLKEALILDNVVTA